MCSYHVSCTSLSKYRPIDMIIFYQPNTRPTLCGNTNELFKVWANTYLVEKSFANNLICTDTSPKLSANTLSCLNQRQFDIVNSQLLHKPYPLQDTSAKKLYTMHNKLCIQTMIKVYVKMRMNISINIFRNCTLFQTLCYLGLLDKSYVKNPSR